MTWEIIAIYLILVAVILAFFREWAPPDVVALSALGAVLLTGILDLGQVLSVFSNPAPITIACMFVLSAGLERSGIIDALGDVFIRIAGKSELRAMLILMTLGAVLSAFVNNTPVVVVFLPIVISLARATGLKASRLLIPLSFASILGGTCTLTGTSTNLIIDGVAQEFGQEAFTMFEITPLGLIYAAIGFIYIATIGRKLLPDRSSLAELIDPPEVREFLTQFRVEKDSTLIGKPLTETLLSEIPSVQVLEVRRRGRALDLPLDRLVIKRGDRLLLTVHGTSFEELKETDGIRFPSQKHLNLQELETREAKMIEGIVGPRSNLAGQTLKQANYRARYGIHVLAIHRQGENLRNELGEVRLEIGDTLLMEGPVEGINRVQRTRDFVTLTERQARPIRKRTAIFAVGITGAFVLGAAFQLLPIPALAILGALAMILAGCLNSREAYAAVSWDIVFLIFGMLALGMAMEKSGAAALVVKGLMNLAGDASPWVILSMIYLLSSVLTELISNNAVAALLTPIVLGVAAQLGLDDPRPFIIAMMFGCSASFATPIGYQTNTYVYGAGGYKFRDFTRIGLPLNIILWLAATFFIPLIWPFSFK